MFALFVGNLHPDVSELMLVNRFCPAGPIQSVHVCRDRQTGSSLGYAYVNFHHRTDAEQALKLFNFELLLERPMRVMWSRWEPTAKVIKGGNIIIKNLDLSIDDAALFDTFSMFGWIVSCKVVESKGFGYIQFEAPEAAAMAIERVNGMLLKGRQVTIEYFKPPEERQVKDPRPSSQNQSTNLYIKNMDYSIDTECLYMTFAQFGTITSAKVIMANGCSKGFGFVCFKSSQDAMRAMNAMNGMTWGTKKVYVGLAKNKKDRQALVQRTNSVKAAETAAPLDSAEAAAPMDSAETAAPLDSVEALETAAPLDSVKAVETAAPLDSVEMAAPLDSVKVVESAAPLDTAETAAPLDSLEAVETAAPLDSVETAAPLDSVKNVETAAPLDTAETAAPLDSLEAVETAAPLDSVEIAAQLYSAETAAPLDSVKAAEMAAPENKVEAVEMAVSEDTVKGSLATLEVPNTTELKAASTSTDFLGATRAHTHAHTQKQ
ncbi:polyadenylate-binding protein 1A-like isoform X2 [Tachysurus fulvidraco]|uniref:polyadenylate-binding protein 1A-like isoform X2 n=1 Tax=Tachysurus fulvidraco TaxID=1234273 RepID=UPI001FEFEE19|nr:polyadenylate-binding protein 1A-like isoform X2 [Tachysurus fulvidraco]